jgi:hypothetical protein
MHQGNQLVLTCDCWGRKVIKAAAISLATVHDDSALWCRGGKAHPENTGCWVPCQTLLHDCSQNCWRQAKLLSSDLDQLGGLIA